MKKIKSSGFSLIELLIVVVIIGLLAAIALPSYSAYVIRANRADAKDMLTNVMFEMERFATRNRTYTLDMTALGFGADPVESAEGLYTIDATECSNGSVATCIILTATPAAGGPQVGDGNLTLDTRGQRSDNWE